MLLDEGKTAECRRNNAENKGKIQHKCVHAPELPPAKAMPRKLIKHTRQSVTQANGYLITKGSQQSMTENSHVLTCD